MVAPAGLLLTTGTSQWCLRVHSAPWVLSSATPGQHYPANSPRYLAQYFGGSVMTVAHDQMQRVVHDATVGMARGAQVLGFRVGCCGSCDTPNMLPDAADASECCRLRVHLRSAAVCCPPMNCCANQLHVPQLQCWLDVDSAASGYGNGRLCCHCRIRNYCRSCSWPLSRQPRRGGQSMLATPKVCAWLCSSIATPSRARLCC